MARPLPTLLLLALALGCAAGPGPRRGGATGPSLAPPEIESLDQRALLLLLADRRIYEPYTVEEALTAGRGLRAELAVSLGRIPDPRAVQVLEALLHDEASAVRREAAFALGQHPAVEDLTALRRAAADADAETAGLAVEALAKQGASLASVVTALSGFPEPERLRRLLPSLFRFDDAGVVALAEAGLTLSDADLRGRAAHALARHPRPEAASPLRTLLADADPWIRGLAARGLGPIGDGADLERLRPLLDETASGPTIQALRAGAQLVAAGVAAPPDSWRLRLSELLDDPRPGVRVTALEVAGRWLLDEVLSRRLAAVARHGSSREQELALLSLARGGDPRALELLREASLSPDPLLRAAAAQGAGAIDHPTLALSLAGDEAPRVRVAALQALLGLEGEERGEIRVRQALEDLDPVVRAVALGWLTEHPRLPMETLVGALRKAWDEPLDDARRGAVEALVARAAVTPAEHSTVVAALEELARHPEYLLRREAVEGLAELGQTPPPLGAAQPGYPVETYREVLLRTRHERRVVIDTERGPILLALDCPRAPLTCLNFLQLARQGFFEGLTFHRVVPDFVVQAGDPRGDGWGGPGYAIRDEITRLRFGAGVLGMALSGPDTGGSQFFVTLTPQPHLDGGYPAFGRVLEGLEVLEQIVQGDRILSVTEVPGATGALQPSRPHDVEPHGRQTRTATR